MLAWLTLALLASVAVSTRYVPTADELRAAFEQGQKFYASGAYDQAIERYLQVVRSRSDLLDEKAVRVAVGDVDAPQDEVARYQIGNAYFKMGEEALHRSANRQGQEERQRARVRADSLLTRARTQFAETEEAATEPALRALARSRELTCRYRMGDYQGAIEAARQLLERYPASAHVEQAMYDIGWSHFEMEEYARSIAAFEALVEQFPGGYRASRALFQIGEAHFALGEATGDARHWAGAVRYYGRLVESQGLESMSERQILRMKREKLAGLVDETALDLAAKALIRMGMCHEQTGDYAAAAAAFERIATQFADERRLVEEAYRRQADMHYSQGDFQACIDVYRRAIAAQPAALGRARMQLLLANRYFETSHFEEAIEEYTAYGYAYPEEAGRVGLPLPGVGLQIARAWFGLAESAAPAEAAEHYRQAELELRRTMAAWPDSEFDLELRFNLGLAVQLQGGEEHLEEALGVFDVARQRAGATGYGRSALFQTARVRGRLGRVEAAAAAYEQLIDECGEAGEGDVARLELGLLWRGAGEFEAAVARLLSVREGTQVYPRSRLEAGRVLSDQGLRERAIAVFAAGLESSPDEEEQALFHYLLGATQAQLANHAAALRSFEAAVAVAGPDLRERALYGRAVTLYKLGRYGDASGYLDRDWADAATATAARRLLAAAYAALGEGQAAMAVYGSLAQGAAEPLERAEYTLAAAEIAYRGGEYERAVTAAQRLLGLPFEDQEPTAERPYYLREKALYLAADSRVRTGDFAGAREAAGQGLRDYGAALYTPDFLFTDGMAALQLGENEAARQRLGQLLERFAAHESAPYGRYYLAYAYFNQTLFDTAAVHFARVVDETPDIEVAPDAAFRRAECFYNAEQYERAGSAYREMIDRYPDSPLREDALYNIAWCALNALPAGDEAPDMAPVRDGFSAYLDAYPDGRYVAMAQYTLAEIRFNEGGYDEAYELFSDVKARFPDSEAATRAGEFISRLLDAIAFRQYEPIAAQLDSVLEAEDEAEMQQLIPRLEALWEQYPETSSGVGAKLNVGVCYQNLRQWRAAVETFDAIIAAGDSGNAKVTSQVVGFSERRRQMIARRHL